MGMEKTLTKMGLLLLLSLAINIASANQWKNLGNYTSITQITPHGNNIWVAAKGGLMVYDKTTGTKTFFEKGPGALPSLSVERVLPNMITGDIWIGTYDNGLAQYNGSTWVNYPFPISNVRLYEMKMAPNGTIWCATSRGIYKFENGQYTGFLLNGTSSNAAAWDIELLSDGTLLCAGNEPFIYNPNTNQLSVIPTSTFAYSDSKVYVANDSTYYYASDHGDVAKFVNGVEVDTFHTPGVIVEMQKDVHGNLMLLTQDKYLYTMYGTHTFVPAPDDFGTTTAFHISNTDDLWEGIINDNDVRLIHKNPQFAVETIDLKRFGLNNNWVHSIKPSADGNLMVLSRFGLQKFNVEQNMFTDAWQIENQPNILDALELNGKLYAATPNNHLMVYENSTWTELGNGILSANGVDEMDVDAAGNIWLAGPNYIAKYDGSQFTLFNPWNGGPAYLEGLYARDVHCDKTRNKVYIASFKGIIEYSNGEFSLHNDTNTVGIMQYYDAINTISEDADHNIYFGTIYGGIIKYDGSTYTSWLLPEHVGNQSVSSIAFVGSTMYVSDNLHGIWMYENGQFDSLNTRNSPLTDNNVMTLCVDAKNNLWAGNLSYGIDVYNRNGIALSVDEVPSIEAMAYPNPSTGIFNISLGSADEMEISVSNLNGQEITKLKANTKASIDLSNQPKGMYIARVNTAIGSKNIKLSFH